MRKNQKGSNKAKEILQQIGFDEVTELSMKDLLAGFDVIYIEEELNGSDGVIIRGKLKTIIKHRFLAVGDAAISFDPLAAQGIFFALYSGIKAGEAIAKSFRNTNHQDQILQLYLNQVESVFEYNRKTLKLHYNNEIRYLNEVYWQKMGR